MLSISIRRPVFATVMSLVIVLLVGWSPTTACRCANIPSIDEPSSRSRPSYPGRLADIIETQVTQVLEDSLSGIEGIDVIDLDQPLGDAARSPCASARRAIPTLPPTTCATGSSRVRGTLPDEIDEPVIAKVEADAQPILYLAFSSATAQSPLEVTDYADRFVKDRLQNLPGVADVRIFGERSYSMRIWLDPRAARRLPLTPQDVEDALAAPERRDPGGPHREPAARVHRPSRDRPARRRSSSATSSSRRPTAIPVRSATSAHGRAGRAPTSGVNGPLQRPATPSRSASSSRPPPTRSTSRKAVREDAAEHQADPAGGHAASTSPTTTSVFIAELDQDGVPHHRRGHRAGRAGDLPLPALAARDADPARHHPGRR